MGKVALMDRDCIVEKQCESDEFCSTRARVLLHLITRSMHELSQMWEGKPANDPWQPEHILEDVEEVWEQLDILNETLGRP